MTAAGDPTLGLDAYLARVAYKGNLAPTLGTLRALHQAHATQIPFENLDVLLGRPIRLDLDGLQAKLVHERRGGYCFEHNTLFAAVLARLGFVVTPLAARVRFGATEPRPRTHMLLKVDIDGAAWLADVGFGGDLLLQPLPLEHGVETQQFGRTYRLMGEDRASVLQSLHRDGWLDLYAFTLEPQLAVDYAMANYFTSTHPSSLFLQQPFVYRAAPGASYRLFDRELSVRAGDAIQSRAIDDPDELLDVLAGTFGLTFPPGTRFPGAG